MFPQLQRGICTNLTVLTVNKAWEGFDNGIRLVGRLADQA